MSQSNTEADLNNLTMSEEAIPLLEAVKKHVAENVQPITEEFFALDAQKTDRWSWHPRQLELLEGACRLIKRLHGFSRLPRRFPHARPSL